MTSINTRVGYWAEPGECVELETKLVWWPAVGCQSGHHREKAIPARKDITIAWLADSFRALIEKSMSICASSSPGCLPARLKSPNEAWSRYLIPDSLSQSDFAAEVIHPSGTSGASSTWTMQYVVVVVVSVVSLCIRRLFSVSRHTLTCRSVGLVWLHAVMVGVSMNGCLSTTLKQM